MVCVTSRVGREADSGVEMMIGTEDYGFDSLLLYGHLLFSG
jgi:hypothetical protein